MLQEQYERMLAKFGADAPGTKAVLRMLEKERAVLEGRSAEPMARQQRVVIQAFAELPNQKRETQPSTNPPMDPAAENSPPAVPPSSIEKKASP